MIGKKLFYYVCFGRAAKLHIQLLKSPLCTLAVGLRAISFAPAHKTHAPQKDTALHPHALPQTQAVSRLHGIIQITCYKLLMFICITFFVSYTSMAQININQISSDSDVVHFVQQQNDANKNPQWSHFYLTDGNEWEDYMNVNQQQQNKIAQNIPQQSWAICDINNDGKKDLIVSGYIARYPEDWTTASFKLLLFLSSNKKDKFDAIDVLNDNTSSYPAYFNILNIQNKNYLKVFTWQAPNELSQQSVFKTDILQYNSFVQNFINYSESVSPIAIHKIEYDVQDDEIGSYHKVILEKKSNGKCIIDFAAENKNDKSSITRSLKIKNALFQSVDSLVRQLNYAGNNIILNAIDSNDHFPITTIIHYADGSKKTIKDFDGTNNYTLMAIYQTMEAAMQTAMNKIDNRNQFWDELISDFAASLL